RFFVGLGCIRAVARELLKLAAKRRRAATLQPTSSHNDGAFHPGVWRALKVNHAFLVERLGGERGARSEHRRSEFAFFTEDAVRHCNIGIGEGDGLANFDGDGGWSKRLHGAFFPDAGAWKHFYGGASRCLCCRRRASLREERARVVGRRARREVWRLWRRRRGGQGHGIATGGTMGRIFAYWGRVAERFGFEDFGVFAAVDIDTAGSSVVETEDGMVYQKKGAGNLGGKLDNSGTAGRNQ